MDSCTLKIFYLVSRKNGLLKKCILPHYMNTDKLIYNHFILMGLDVVEFIIYTF